MPSGPDPETIKVARGLAKQGRLDEAVQKFQAAAEAGVVAAMRDLGYLYEDLGQTAQAERWHRAAYDAGDVGHAWRGAHLLEQRGAIEEALSWYRMGASANRFADNRVGDLLVELGRYQDAVAWHQQRGRDGQHHVARSLLELGEVWLRRAAAAGNAAAMTDLGVLSFGREDFGIARRWWTKAEQAGSSWASVRLQRLESQRAGVADPQSPPESSSGTGEVAAVVVTALISTAVVPFVHAMAGKVAEGSYEAARTMIRRLIRKYGTQKPAAAASTKPLLIVEDAAHGLSLYLRTDTSDEAFRALADLDLAALTQGEQHHARLVWNPETRSWEIQPPGDR